MTLDILSSLQSNANEKNLPRYCSIEVTQHCNFQCKHCYIPRYPSKKVNRVSLDEYKRFFSELKKIGGLSVCFTGGEPLLFKEELFELLEMVKSEGMMAVLYTNGSLVTREIARNVKEKRVLEVAVTLYGSCAETMDKFTGHSGSFEKTLQGIKWLLEENNHVNVRWPVTRENLEELTAFYNLVRNLGAKPSHYHSFDRCWDGSECPYKLEMEEDDFIQYFDTLSRLDIFDEILSELKKGRATAEQKISGWRHLCSAGRGHIYLGSDGFLYPCSHIRKPLGNIVNTSLHKIWQEENPVLKEVRAATLDKMECADCEYLVDCGICIAEFYLENGSFTKPDKHTCQLAKLGRRIRNYVNTRYIATKK